MSEREPLLLDGGLATEVERRGHALNTPLWSAALLHEQPDAILAAHRAFLEAGAQVVTSASYQASQAGFAAQGLGDRADELLVRSVRLARRAVEHSAATEGARQPLVAASIGPWGAAQADGSEYRGRYPLSTKELRRFHRARLRALDAAGPDLLACETIPDRREAEVLHALLQFAETPAWISFQCADDRHLADGTPLREIAARFADHPRVLAIGVNCVAPEQVAPLLRECRAGAPDRVLVAYPNSGEYWNPATRSWEAGPYDPDWAGRIEAWLALGARWLGGCCRVGPSDIACMRAAIDGWPFDEPGHGSGHDAGP